MRTYVELTGKTISGIPEARRIRSGHPLEPTDKFLISQPVLSSVSPDRTYVWGDKTYTNEYRSLNISYDSLSSIAYDDLTAGFGLKSMAWESSADYSLADHIHNYSALSVDAAIKPSKQQISDGEVWPIAMFSINTQKTTLYMPEVVMYNAPKPYIGQLKFLALCDLPQIPNTEQHYRSEQFDGWIYPDGRSLSRSMFPKAFTAFGTSYGSASSTTFNVPSLNNFFLPYKLTASNQETSLVALQNQQVGLLAHTHDIDSMQLQGDVDGVLSVAHKGNTSYGGGTHGRKNEASKTYQCNITFDCDDLQCTASNILNQSDARKTWPNHNLLPVMIYIGDCEG